MKYILLIFGLMVSIKAVSQVSQNIKPELILVRENPAKAKEFTLKPNREVRVKTRNRQKYKAMDYTLVGDSLLILNKDTIALKDIVLLSGQVRGDLLRKVVGFTGYFAANIAFAASIILAFSSMALSGSTASLFLPIPGYVVFKLSLLYIKGRRFNLAEKWDTKVTPGF